MAAIYEIDEIDRFIDGSIDRIDGSMDRWGDRGTGRNRMGRDGSMDGAMDGGRGGSAAVGTIPRRHRSYPWLGQGSFILALTLRDL